MSTCYGHKEIVLVWCHVWTNLYYSIKCLGTQLSKHLELIADYCGRLRLGVVLVEHNDFPLANSGISCRLLPSVKFSWVNTVQDPNIELRFEARLLHML